MLMTNVADGMRHLESIGCVHRDLATRNVLLTGVPGDPERPEVAKLCDFGLGRRTTGQSATTAGQRQSA